MNKKKNRAKKSTKIIPHALLISQSEAGRAWLSRLGEAEFRDKILAHLFARMKKEGTIQAFQNIHGRNDKGIDYLIAERTPLRRSILGIQVKSKPITRSGDSSSLSSLTVKTECEAAMAHEFHLERDAVRLDAIAVWTSAAITEDAEKEFLAPGNTLKIQVVKAPEIFALLEKFTPNLLSKIPECALYQYVSAKAHPKAKAFKLLGVPLNPRENFLTPQLTREDPNSTSRLKTRNQIIGPKPEEVGILSIATAASHTIIKGGDLSGKSYLLEHIQSLAAENGLIPFLLSSRELRNPPKPISKLLARYLPLYSAKDIEGLADTNRMVLLTDDIDEVNSDVRNDLFALDPAKITVIGTARSLSPPGNVQQYFIAGVDFSSLPRFLRSLDITSQTTTFTDRAHSFISRSLASSGLPDNPFTVAMLLAECQLTDTKFSTPTMGRLIERFIELQLGSHSEGKIFVDFETKREFLTRLGGKLEDGISTIDLRKLIARHINTRSLPHNPTDFFDDLITAGVLTLDEGSERASWSHPVINQYFWVKNLANQGQLKPIVAKLRSKPDSTLAAIAGSQMRNARDLIEPLLAEVAALKMPSDQDFLRSVLELSQDLLPSEEAESEMLARIERVETDPNAREEEAEKASERISTYEMTEADRKRVERELAPIIRRVIENKFHVTMNLASLIVNARDSRTADKQRSVREILRSNVRLGKVLQEFFALVFAGKPNADRLVAWLRIYATFQFTDTMLGDPFLVTIFRDILKQKLSDEERILVLDLSLGCGDVDRSVLVNELRRVNRPEVTYAFYFRVLALYFFRFHRESEKKELRKLLAQLRGVHAYVKLPAVAPVG